METSNAKQASRSNDPSWYFLIEYPLGEFMPDQVAGDALMAGSLFQTIRDLGVPLAYIKNIDMTLTGFAKEALVQLKHGSKELPRHVRVFCQKKAIEDAASAKTSRPDHAEQTMEQAPIEYPSGTIMNEGWGYFVIERGRDFASHPFKESCRVIELYIYKEGQ